MQEYGVNSQTELAGQLGKLYEAQLHARPDDDYLRQHGQPRFVHGSVMAFRFYLPYLPANGRILDWGCRHAPDSCLIRTVLGEQVELDGCDVTDADQYPVFFDYARLRYVRLQHVAQLPYPDAAFDAVVASGVLEHVPMDYESLKELYRVLRPAGRLILTYLPNLTSIEEWWLRWWRRSGFHLKRYSLPSMRRLLQHTGFRPIVAGYQTQLDVLPVDGTRERALRPFRRLVQLHRLTSCLCAVAEKVAGF